MATDSGASGSATHGRVENDLAKLKGIGPKYAELLTSIGGDSIKELRRNPARLKEMIETRHGPVVGFSEAECTTWIEEAKHSPPDPRRYLHPQETQSIAPMTRSPKRRDAHPA